MTNTRIQARINSDMTPGEIANEVIRVTGYTDDLANVAMWLITDYGRINHATKDGAREHLARFAEIVTSAVFQLGKLQLSARDQWGFGWGTIAAAVGVSRSTVRGQIETARRDYAANGTWFDQDGEHKGTAADAASAPRQVPEPDGAD
jgi:hypothetical protein